MMFALAPGDSFERSAALVRRNKAGAAQTQLVRLRVPDKPGSLARLSAHFAEHAVNVLGLEVVEREAGFAVDDVLVEGPGLDKALATFGNIAAVLTVRRGVALRDPGLAMAEACEAVTNALGPIEAYAELVRTAPDLVFAEEAFVLVAEESGYLVPYASTVAGLPAVALSEPSLLVSAVASGEPLTADGRIPWAPTTYRDLLPSGTVAVVPGGRHAPIALVLVRRDDARFLGVELSRLQALLRVAAGALVLHGAGANGADVLFPNERSLR